MNDIGYITVIGFTAQALFSARMLLQWILSEKSKKSVSPVIYWQLSLLGSFLFFIYGWLRIDFALILGQLISYYIYIWNLKMQNNWGKINVIIRRMILCTPVVIICWLLSINEKEHIERLWKDIPFVLLLYGSIGQIIFTFRFIYQWWYSNKKGESLLPAGFWILSLAGSCWIISYGIMRKDIVLIIGQSFGFLTYARNLFIGKKSKHENINNR
ncbi:MAG: lipid-A-disaccharide synthase N-terminal domain-containing protein [Tannerella sp.]|jgi:lipid-A-disaccharide synthase-like uncharacterized protein|nr:lipid-A-disaccharide synthase N-terminal domain-containing protein [Tannerella sp.]